MEETAGPRMIFALSGFLGVPKDWNFLGLHTTLSPIRWEHFSTKGFSEWAVSFNGWAIEQKGDPRPRVLMGYSLGGRLALHALIGQPRIWDGAVIISAHPGLDNERERKKRQATDQQWAERFESEDWESLMHAWNAQEVFSHDRLNLKRKEEDYARDKLSDALLNFSLGMQKNLALEVAALQMPLLWVTGSLDFRFCQIAQALNFSHPESLFCQVEGAGHRILSSHSDELSSLIKRFELKAL